MNGSNFDWLDADHQQTMTGKTDSEKPAGGNHRVLGERLWTLTFILILGVNLFGYITVQGLNSGISVYFSVTGTSVALAGVGVACFSGTAAVSRILAGFLIDRFNRAPLMTIGTIIMTFGTIGILIINNIVFFIIWRVMQGLGFSVATTVAATSATDVLPASRLGEGIGYYGLGQAVAYSLGPTLALVLVMTDPPENLFLGLTASAILSF
ncbi:MAG: MFS transporter, partial [Eggerthellaceae bacterium]|nr:MFS transporter [Eggerthellaceae bacterium]